MRLITKGNDAMAERKSDQGSRKNIVAELVEGVVEEVKGKAKEAAGKAADREDLYREGQAQQDKADSEREAAKKLVRATEKSMTFEKSLISSSIPFIKPNHKAALAIASGILGPAGKILFSIRK